MTQPEPADQTYLVNEGRKRSVGLMEWNMNPCNTFGPLVKKN